MKRILLIVMMLAVAAQAAPTYKVVYIVNQRDTTTHNANVDSIRYDMVNDPQHQLPGTWQVDLLSKDSVESRSAAFWTNYNLIITWGPEEGSGSESGDTTDYDTFLDGVLDTIHRPIIARNAWIANGNPMRLGTAARAVTARCGKIKSTSHFITKRTYTDNFNYGDSVRIYATSDPSVGAIRGMANSVQTLVRWDGEIRSDDADTALVAVLDSGATNASGTAAPHRRAFFALNSSWAYSSWAARDMWYRLLRWSVMPQDIDIDTSITQVQIAREGWDCSFLEYSGSTCQKTWYYGGVSSSVTKLLTGYDERDRTVLARVRTGALNKCLPDTNGTWAYDIVAATIKFKIKGIAENVSSNSFSFWEALFEAKPDTLWYDYKASNIQLDSTCSSYNAAENHALSNAYYLKYPTIPWNSQQAMTRGTDYENDPFDSIWVQDPVVESYMTFSNVKDYIVAARADSATNKGLMTHTIAPRTADAEISLYPEWINNGLSDARNGPLAIVSLVWRAANTAAPDLDSSIAFSPDSLNFECYVGNGSLTNKTVQVYNGSSDAVFSCGTIAENPAVDWGNISLNLGNGVTPFYLVYHVDATGLSAGYYYTYLDNTCASVPNSPASVKVVLNVLPVASRPNSGGFLVK